MIIRPGMRIVNSAADRNNWGTIGGTVYKNQEPFLLTCFHCVWHDDLSWDTFSTNLPSTEVGVVNGSIFQPIGHIEYAHRDEWVDIALIRLREELITPDIFEIEKIGIPTGPRRLIYNASNEVFVQKFGAKSQYTYGKFIGYKHDASFDYPPHGSSPHHLSYLFQVQSGGLKLFSQPGDSGSFILDLDNQVVGVLLGSNLSQDIFYGISIDFIIEKFEICFTSDTYSV